MGKATKKICNRSFRQKLAQDRAIKAETERMMNKLGLTEMRRELVEGCSRCPAFSIKAGRATCGFEPRLNIPGDRLVAPGCPLTDQTIALSLDPYLRSRQ